MSRRQAAMSGMYDEPSYAEPEYAPPPEPEKDKYEKLKEAKELLDAGILTEDEFAAEKARILAE